MSDINKLMDIIHKSNLVGKLTKLRSDTKWKFYEFLYICFDVYEPKTTIGKAHELLQHFKER